MERLACADLLRPSPVTIYFACWSRQRSPVLFISWEIIFNYSILAFNSIRKGGADADDLNVLQEALDKSVILTRAFSEYTQEPAWVPAFEFLEIIDAAIKIQVQLLSIPRLKFSATVTHVWND